MCFLVVGWVVFRSTGFGGFLMSDLGLVEAPLAGSGTSYTAGSGEVGEKSTFALFLIPKWPFSG